MAVTFIMGRAGAGKTHACLTAIRDRLAERASGPPLMLITPEQASLQTERALALISPGGGYLRAEVLSFSRLIRRVWSEVGREPPVISAEARVLALRLLLRRKPQLAAHFGRAAHTPSFYQAVEATLNELLSEGVTPAELLRAATNCRVGAADRLRALGQLLDAYLSWLGEHRLDPALRLKKLRQQVMQTPWLHEAEVWVDGFAGFTQEEAATLVALAQRARAMWITSLCDPNPPPAPHIDLFSRARDTQAELRAQFEAAGVAVGFDASLIGTNHRVTATSPLAQLEARLGGPSRTRRSATTADLGDTDRGAVRVLACGLPRDEVMAVARFIRERVARGAARFSDFAVIARDLAPWAETIDAVFADFDIPRFIDRRRPLPGHPVVRLVHGVFEALRSDFAPQCMRSLLQTELIPIRRRHRERLDLALQESHARGPDAWRAAQWPLSNMTPRAQAGLENARRRIVDGLEPLLLESTRGPCVASAWLQLLYELLQTWDTPRRLGDWSRQAHRHGDYEAAEVHRLAWDQLCDVLSDIHEVFGTESLTADEFAALLADALRDITLGVAPPELDQVLVTAIDRSRHPEVKHAWLLGFNEGVFPKPAEPDPVLSDEDRAAAAAAGLAALRPRGNDVSAERLFAYIACTRPSDSLTISHATRTGDGQPLAPSPLLADVFAVHPICDVEDESSAAVPVSLRDFVRTTHAHREHERQTLTANDRPQTRRYAALRRALETDPTTRTTLARLTRGERYTNNVTPVAPYRGARGVWTASHSELNRYLRCPFKHFARHGLDLDEQQLAPSPARSNGLLMHALLAATVQRAIDSGSPVQDIPPDAWRNWRDEATQRHFNDFGPWRADARFWLGAIGQQVDRVLDVHVERWRRGVMQPLACELPLSDADNQTTTSAIAPLRVALRGSIDRIDAADLNGQRFLVVYDYKRRSQSLRTAPYLVEQSLQLALYGLAAQQRFPTSDVVGLLIAPLQAKETTGSAKFPNAAPLEQHLELFKPRGVLTPRAVEVLDPNNHGGVVHVKRTKMGQLAGDVGDDARIDHWLATAAETIAVAARGVAAGDIAVRPVVHADTLPCRTCGYQALCRFDRRHNRPVAAESVLPLLASHATSNVS